MSTSPAAPCVHRMRRHVTALALTMAIAVAAAGATIALPTSAQAAIGAYDNIPVGDEPQGIGVNPAGTLAMVANKGDGTVSVIDTMTMTVTDTIVVGGAPADVTFSPDGTEAWVATWSGNTVEVIDVATLQVVDTISAGTNSMSVVFSHDGTIAWVINYVPGSVAVVDTATRTVLRTIAGFSLPQAGVLSPDGSTLYVAESGGKLGRLSTADDTKADTPTGPQTQDLAPTQDWSEMWVVNHSNSTISIVDLTTHTVVETLNTAPYPAGIAMTPDGQQMLVGHELGVQAFDIATRSVTAALPASEVITELVAVPNQFRILASVWSHDVVSVWGEDEIPVVTLAQERLAGADRFATGVEISKKGFPSGASTVFVANGLDFPDALAAGPAAGKLDASLLLTSPTSLPSIVRNEVIRLNPDTIYIVGGTGAVSASVEAALKTIQPNTIRLAGANRYATGAAIVAAAWAGTTVPEVFIATGRNYPDALSAGAVAAAEGIPVILIDGSLSTVPQGTLDQIALLDPAQITIAGGTGVVSSGIQTHLTKEFGAGVVRRLAGADRYATSTAINQDAYPTTSGVIFATGTSFADALAGAAFAGEVQMPVYLVPPTCVTTGGLIAVQQEGVHSLFLLGGTGSLSTAVENLIAC